MRAKTASIGGFWAAPRPQIGQVLGTGDANKLIEQCSRDTGALVLLLNCECHLRAFNDGS